MIWLAKVGGVAPIVPQLASAFHWRYATPYWLPLDYDYDPACDGLLPDRYFWPMKKCLMVGGEQGVSDSILHGGNMTCFAHFCPSQRCACLPFYRTCRRQLGEMGLPFLDPTVVGQAVRLLFMYRRYQTPGLHTGTCVFSPMREHVLKKTRGGPRDVFFGFASSIEQRVTRVLYRKSDCRARRPHTCTMPNAASLSTKPCHTAVT